LDFFKGKIGKVISRTKSRATTGFYGSSGTQQPKLGSKGSVDGRSATLMAGRALISMKLAQTWLACSLGHVQEYYGIQIGQLVEQVSRPATWWPPSPLPLWILYFQHVGTDLGFLYMPTIPPVATHTSHFGISTCKARFSSLVVRRSLVGRVVML
jgi:hypothetical protein